MVEGAIEVGVKAISRYAFSTENWKRSPDEVKFLMGFNRDVIRRRRDEMHALGVACAGPGGRRGWASVIKELQIAEELTRDNDVLTLTMCVNYGGRAELADAARSIARRCREASSSPTRSTRGPSRGTSTSELPDADLVWRTSGEQRLSNFMLWQAAYCRDGLQGRALARRRPSTPVAGDRQSTGRTQPTTGTAVPPPPSGGGELEGGGRWRRPTRKTPEARHSPSRGDRAAVELQVRPEQVPKISRVWLTSVKPCSAATESAQRSTAGPSTSTVRAAGAADQVVVVRAAAPAVEGLAVLGAQHVDLAGVGERLQRPVDRRQPDVLAARAEQVVDLLGAAEVLEGRERRGHRPPLPGRTRSAAAAVVSARHSGSPCGACRCPSCT